MWQFYMLGLFCSGFLWSWDTDVKAVCHRQSALIVFSIPEAAQWTISISSMLHIINIKNHNAYIEYYDPVLKLRDIRLEKSFTTLMVCWWIVCSAHWNKSASCCLEYLNGPYREEDVPCTQPICWMQQQDVHQSSLAYHQEHVSQNVALLQSIASLCHFITNCLGEEHMSFAWTQRMPMLSLENQTTRASGLGCRIRISRH